MSAPQPILWHGRPIEDLSHAELLDAFRRTYADLQMAERIAARVDEGWTTEAALRAERHV